MALYSDAVLEHYRNPRNAGQLEDADAVGVAENAACGDVMHLYVKVEEGRIRQAAFKAFGCAVAIAAGSRLTEMVQGSTLEEMGRIRQEDVAQSLGGLPPMKQHAAALAADAIRAVLEDYRHRQEQ
jgi:nitrogen fixation NifU-like protein